MDEEINATSVDRYTSAHAGLGALLARVRLPWWAAIGTSIAWELVESRVKRLNPELFPYSSADSWQNSTIDTLAVLVGYAVTSYALADGMTTREQTALDSAVGSTVGGAVGSVGFGMAAGKFSEERTDRARLGYRVGGAVGGGVGALMGRHGPISAAGAVAGGALLGPMGAALGGFLTGGIFREANPELESEPSFDEGFEEYM